ncbi:hypothetical protein CC2G_011839 [Coprinopsis cinerea AmutBmut pab1-1]|nr:hypothetical protein CC2G_011839 [Coprinopsis cinerea AmutBmut pab1-1]
MGFLKRLFSIGGKNKKLRKSRIVHNVPLPEVAESKPEPATPADEQGEEDHEEAVSRLLRSSSQRYAVVAEVDYTNMPPMPHPINDVVNLQAPSASTVSLVSATMGSKSGYNVTVHRRERQTSCESRKDAETPKAKNRYSAHLNANDSRVLRLRSDPSVASLVSLYDEHGRLPEAAFSNSPPSSPKATSEEPIGRAQCKRSGSTLRQLLGAPAGTSTARGSGEFSGDEGDISWAERFLGETDDRSDSTHSSLPLPTPISDRAVVISDISEISLQTNATVDNPAISSMDVELSVSTNASEIFGESFRHNHSYNKPEPTTPQRTPQRASQVFDFITKKKQSKPALENDDRPLPQLPSAFSSPSSDGAHSINDHLGSRFSEDSCESAFAKERISAIPIPCDAPLDSRPVSEQSFTYKFGDTPQDQDIPRFSFNVDMNAVHEPQVSQQPPADIVIDTTHADRPALQQIVTPQTKTRPVKVLMTGPTKVIVTAPTPGTAHPNSGTRIPRGPRSLSSRRRISGSHRSGSRRSTQLERSHTGSDMLSSIPSPRYRSSHHRSTSGSSSHGSNNENEPPRHHRSSSSRDSRSDRDRSSKERRSVHKGSTIPEGYISKPMSLGVKAEIPLTPLRSQNTNSSHRSSNSSRRSSTSLFRPVVNQATFDPPSTRNGDRDSIAYGYGKTGNGYALSSEIDLRYQRAKAREAEREKSGLYGMVSKTPKRKSTGPGVVLGNLNFF